MAKTITLEMDANPSAPLKDQFDLLLDAYPSACRHQRGLTRFEMMQLGGLLMDLRREHGFMCFELQFAAIEAVRSYHRRAADYVDWVFECEWDATIAYWGTLMQPGPTQPVKP